VIGRGLVFGATMAALLSLAACGEKPQAMDATAKKSDAEPWTVSSSATPAFTVPGWKVGDKAAWEEQLRKRNQSQNDYVR
jgi:ABC-type glycerol-3-phosphate transport system substrate-binding protein